jgi:hypothetical protein
MHTGRLPLISTFAVLISATMFPAKANIAGLVITGEIRTTMTNNIGFMLWGGHQSSVMTIISGGVKRDLITVDLSPVSSFLKNCGFLNLEPPVDSRLLSQAYYESGGGFLDISVIKWGIAEVFQKRLSLTATHGESTNKLLSHLLTLLGGASDDSRFSNDMDLIHRIYGLKPAWRLKPGADKTVELISFRKGVDDLSMAVSKKEVEFNHIELNNTVLVEPAWDPDPKDIRRLYNLIKKNKYGRIIAGPNILLALIYNGVPEASIIETRRPVSPLVVMPEIYLKPISVEMD